MRQWRLPAGNASLLRATTRSRNGEIRTDFDSWKYDILVATPANAECGLYSEEIDAFEECAARLEESPEMRVEVACLRARLLCGLCGLLSLFFHGVVRQGVLGLHGGGKKRVGG